jgi:hypothetical protein
LRRPLRHSVRRLATTTRSRRRLFGRVKRPFVRLLSRRRRRRRRLDCTARTVAATATAATTTTVTHGGQVRIGGAHVVIVGSARVGRPIGHGVRGANRSAQQGGWIGVGSSSVGCIIRGWRWRRSTAQTLHILCWIAAGRWWWWWCCGGDDYGGFSWYRANAIARHPHLPRFIVRHSRDGVATLGLVNCLLQLLRQHRRNAGTRVRRRRRIRANIIRVHCDTGMFAWCSQFCQCHGNARHGHESTHRRHDKRRFVQDNGRRRCCNRRRRCGRRGSSSSSSSSSIAVAGPNSRRCKGRLLDDIVPKGSCGGRRRGLLLQGNTAAVFAALVLWSSTTTTGTVESLWV